MLSWHARAMQGFSILGHTSTEKLWIFYLFIYVAFLLIGSVMHIRLGLPLSCKWFVFVFNFFFHCKNIDMFVSRTVFTLTRNSSIGRQPVTLNQPGLEVTLRRQACQEPACVRTDSAYYVGVLKV